MKKIISALFGAAILLTSCGGNQPKLNAAQLANKDFADSLAIAYGKAFGVNALNNFSRQMELLTEAQQKNFSKENFVKGMQFILNVDTADMAYLTGVYAGFNALQTLMQTNEMADVAMDPKTLIESFKGVFMSDSITPEMNIYSVQYQMLQQQVMNLAQEKRTRELTNSPEAKTNAEEGKKYVDARLAEGFQQTPSGLVYQIINPGEGEKVQSTDNIKLKYTGKHIDGKEFDSTGDNTRTMRASGFIPGFSEGLQLLGKGGSAILVIPSDIAYGLEGAGNGIIGPNETIVFEVTVEDINPQAN